MTTRLRVRLRATLLPLLFCLSTASGLQRQGDAEFTDANWIAFGPSPAVSFPVSAVAVNKAGHVFAAGTSCLTTVCKSQLAKWDGTTWSEFDLGPGYISALAVSDDDVYVGGGFNTIAGVPANNIARWDGTRWFALDSGVNEPVSSLATASGNVFAGGRFTTAGGSPAKSVAKWDGRRWSSLGSGIDAVSILVASGNDVYVAGSVRTDNGVVARNIAKWDGARWSALGSGVNGAVSALTVDGDLYVGGTFTTAGGNPARNIAKWDGSRWSALGEGVADPPAALAASEGNVYISNRVRPGIITTRISKWDGNRWVDFQEGFTGRIDSLVAWKGDLYAGGFLKVASAPASQNIAKWDGSRWSGLIQQTKQYGFNRRVRALAISGNDVYFGGEFTIVGSVAANRIAKWDGRSWSSIGKGMRHSAGDIVGVVSALAISGQNVYAGGAFDIADDGAASNIVMWDGNHWSPLGSGADAMVTALAVSGPNLYVGGRFSTVGGVAANHVAKWDGRTWSALGSGVINGVETLVVSGNDVYVSGFFIRDASATKASDGFAVTPVDVLLNALRVGTGTAARWDGNRWLPVNAPLGVHGLGTVGTDLYAGGEKSGPIGASIMKWNGTRWSPVGQAVDGVIRALAIRGSDIYAAGEFTRAGSLPVKNIAKWNGSRWSALASGVDGEVSAMAISGDELYVGGSFLTAGGKPSAFAAIAKLSTR